MDTYNLIELPTEIILNLLLSLSDSDLHQICLLNTTISQICSSDFFWQLKVNQLGFTRKHPNKSWKQFYQYLKTPIQLDVIESYQDIITYPFKPDVFILPTETISQIISKIVSLYKERTINMASINRLEIIIEPLFASVKNVQAKNPIFIGIPSNKKFAEFNTPLKFKLLSK